MGDELIVKVFESPVSQVFALFPCSIDHAAPALWGGHGANTDPGLWEAASDQED